MLRSANYSDKIFQIPSFLESTYLKFKKKIAEKKSGFFPFKFRFRKLAKFRLSEIPIKWLKFRVISFSDLGLIPRVWLNSTQDLVRI